MAALQHPTMSVSLINFGCGLPLNLLQWYLVATSGQTLGKKIVKTRIVKLDGSKVDWVSGVMLRYWPIVGLALLGNLLHLTWLTGLVAFVDPLFIFGSGRRTLHDLIAGTKVVDASKV
jgi:uncharacterized RDD family membrane protein YckC